MIMKPTFELKTPPWIKFPELSEFTIGWRMGYGEAYGYDFWKWYRALTPTQQQEYQILYPRPCFWHFKYLETESFIGRIKFWEE